MNLNFEAYKLIQNLNKFI